MREQTWTAKYVEIRLEEAAVPLRQLPSVIAQPQLCSWPTVIRDYWENCLAGEGRRSLGSATPKAIAEMDEALEWLRWLEPKDSKIVWLRACHIRWPRIAERLHLSRRSAWQHWKTALETIARRINCSDAAIRTLPYRIAPGDKKHVASDSRITAKGASGADFRSYFS